MRIQDKGLPNNERRKEPYFPTEILPFGVERTDHMLNMDYNGREWVNPRIVPYKANLSIPAGAIGLDYGQEFFEGTRVFKHKDGELYIFRVDKNAERWNESAWRMRMASMPEELLIEAIESLVDIERLWYPEGQDGATLYIRPKMIAMDDDLRVHPSETYLFNVMLSPSGPYFPEGFNSTGKLLITGKIHRAAPGGSGNVKTSCNYGPSMLGRDLASRFGASDALYIDVTNAWLNEAGAMNHCHVTSDGDLVIPTFSDTILKSITSMSVIELREFMGINVVQKDVSLEDFLEGVDKGRIVEAGGFGTAAVVAPVGTYYVLKDDKIDDGLFREIVDGKVPESQLEDLRTVYEVGDCKIGPVLRRVYDTLTGIQTGIIPAPEGWLHKVRRRA